MAILPNGIYPDDFPSYAAWKAAYGDKPRAGATPTTPTIPDLPKSSVPTIAGATDPGSGDIYSAILGDPGFQSFKSGSDFALSSAAAQRRAALRALIMQYGGIGGLSDRYGDIDQATLAAARNNPYSQEAQAQRTYAQGVEAFKRSLAARGALQSGDLGYGLDQLDYNKGQSEYDLAQQFGSQAQGYVNDYAGIEASQLQQLAGAITDAEGRVKDWWTPPAPPAGGGGDSAPDPNANLIWYRDPGTGELYSVPQQLTRAGVGLT